MAENSGVNIGFKINPSAEDKNSKVEQPAATTVIKDSQEDLNASYEDKSSVTIALVENYSLYRKANRASLEKRVDYIGSCVESSRRLSASDAELKKYFPNIIGISATNSDFITRVKQYLNNIRIPVDTQGVVFNTTFIYEHKSDYLKVVAKLNAIEQKYNAVSRNNLAELRKALQIKINEIDALEREKCNYGRPLNPEEYLMYRHCLLYNDVAKDMAFINGDPNIRFYIKDNKREEERKRKQHDMAIKAMKNLVTLFGDKTLFDAVYVQYCVVSAKPILPSIIKTDMEKEEELQQFAANAPEKFNKIYENKDIRTIATIEMLIAKGELIKSEYNQNITSPDGTLIGANMTEALAWFKSPENTSAVNAYKAKLKNF